ncbi:TonB-dependent Receptor Plug Domain [Hymenobacter actinosclerus]|uniref:TonB-dependent Receptor Plug Domain n=2 Tax=Hymenobacter actinosclerus TaxID=82805 RepID=A0A1I0EHZ5_9BACT|nr:TonB-dependent Receptor Plug Domain [Hymenobacter actinosclerus]
MLPLLLLGFAASAQTTTPTDAAPRIGLNKPAGSAGNTTGVKAKPAPLYVVDGKIIDAFQLSAISPDQIEKVDVLKGTTAIARYGEKAKDGAILITLKPAAATK